jgi:hypothetical protein
MTPALRKLNLTAHVATSVGWLGAVAAFLALSIAGLTSRDADVVRAAYLAMDLIGQFVIVPLAFAALLTGLVQSLGTRWGLVRHYWVSAKFALTVAAALLLVLHQFTAVAAAARRVSGTASGSVPAVGRLGAQPVVDAGLALLVLLAATTLSVVKPWGLTPFGRRGKMEGRADGDPQARPAVEGVPLAVKVSVVIVAVILAVFVAVHLAGGGLGHHGH